MRELTTEAETQPELAAGAHSRNPQAQRSHSVSVALAAALKDAELSLRQAHPKIARVKDVR